MSAEFYEASNRILSAAANGLYQGLLITLLAGLALRFLVRTNAATRHAVWSGILVLVAALIPAHIFLSAPSRAEIPKAPMRSSVNITIPPRAVAEESFPALNDFALDLPSMGTEDVSGETPATATGTVALPGIAPDAEKTLAAAPVAAVPTSPRIHKTAITLPRAVCLFLVATWLLLAGIRLAMIAWRMVEVRRLKASSEVAGEVLQGLFERVRGAIASRRQVQLKLSREHRTAVLLGFVHPVVLLPAEMNEDTNEAEAAHVLRHELAHVARRDDWSNLAQQLIQSVLFFHPAVWWISSKLSLEREIACDDHVLAAGGGSRAYALTLANVAGRMNHVRLLLAPGVTTHKSQLQQRISMILNTERNRSPRLARNWLGFFTAAAALLAFAAIIAGPRLVLAAPSADEAPPAPASPAALVDESSIDSELTPPSAEALWPTAVSGSRTKTLIAENGAVIVAPPAPAAPVAPGATPAPFAYVSPPVMVTPRPAAVYHSAWTVKPVPARLASLSEEDSDAAVPKRHASIEERLDRIERMLADIQNRDGGKPRAHSSLSVTATPSVNAVVGTTITADQLDLQLAAKYSADQVKRAAEQAQRAVEQAHRAMEAGERAAEQAMRDAKAADGKALARAQNDFKWSGPDKSGMELQALRSARESLQAQIKTLESQIKRLEVDQNRLKKPTVMDDADVPTTDGKSAPDKLR